MGRLRQWIDRATSTGRRSTRGGAARRRPLGFERYESRIALSAATQTDWADVDADSLLIWRDDDGVFVHVNFSVPEEYLANFVNYDFDDVVTIAPTLNFSQWRSKLPTVGEQWNIPLLSQAALNAPAPGEGGLISLGDYFLTDASTDATLNSSSQTLVTNAFDGDSDGGATGSFLSLVAGVRQYIASDGATGLNFPDWQIVVGPIHEGVDAGGADETFGTSGALDSPGFIRILLPTPEADAQGGSIDLAAMLEPIGPAAAGSSAHLAAAPRAATGEARATFVAADNDGLRARAVVYNVALIDDFAAADDGEAADRSATAANNADPSRDAERPVRAAAPRPEPTERRATRIDPAQLPTGAEQAAVDRRIEPTPADAAKVNAAPVADDTASNSAAVYDAAFGDWDEELAPLDADVHASAGLSFASTREHTIVGLAVAAVVGAPALIRRTRRSKSTAPVEQASGLR